MAPHNRELDVLPMEAVVETAEDSEGLPHPKADGNLFVLSSVILERLLIQSVSLDGYADEIKTQTLPPLNEKLMIN